MCTSLAVGHDSCGQEAECEDGHEDDDGDLDPVEWSSRVFRPLGLMGLDGRNRLNRRDRLSGRDGLVVAL